MLKVNDNGYNPKDAESIRNEIITMCKNEIEGFEERPADLNNNLINESVIICLQLENIAQFLFNSYAPSYANQTIFEQFANEQGLRRKGAFKSQCEFKIKGPPYSLIPAGTQVTNKSKSIKYTIQDEYLIGSAGELIVSGESDDDGSNLKKDELNIFVNDLKGVSVSNTTSPTPPSEIESFDKFKTRVQGVWRSPRSGTYDYLLSTIKSIEGVITKCVTFRVIERYIDIDSNNKKFFNSAELVVLGGDSVAITEALYKSVGFTSFMWKSYPSDNDETRRIKTQITLGNSIIPFEFTRPKKTSLSVEVKIVLVGLTADSDSLQQLTQSNFESYFNDLQVGSKINKLQLNALFFEGFQKSGSKWTEVSSIDFVCKKNGVDSEFDSNNFLEIAFDEYLELESYKVTING